MKKITRNVILHPFLFFIWGININAKAENKSDKKDKDEKKEIDKKEDKNNEKESNDDKKDNKPKQKDNDDDYEEPQPDPENDDIDQKIDINENIESKKEFKKKINNLTQAVNYLKYEENQEINDLILIKSELEKALNKDPFNKNNLYYYILANSRLAILNLGLGEDGNKFLENVLNTQKKLNEKAITDPEFINLKKNIINELYNIYIERGKKYLTKGYYERSKENFYLANKVKPNTADTYLYFSLIYLINNNNEECSEYIRKYHKLGGKDALSYYAMAIILDRQKKLYAAMDIINQGIKFNPYNNALIERRFKILKKLNLIENYNQKIKNSDIIKGAKFYQLSVFHKYYGNEEKFRNYLKKSVRYSPNQFETQFELGKYYFNKAAEILGIKKRNTETKSTSKKLKKKISPESKLKRYFKYAKKRFELANKLKPKQKIIIDKIKFIENYLKKDKKSKQPKNKK
ncbi:MAG: hypothetical protein GY830_08625 [Bacteroidetes bacterium]|nr:hypothetical protein [Bacteroidota bacterium]